MLFNAWIYGIDGVLGVSWIIGGVSQRSDENFLKPFCQNSELKQRMRKKSNETRYVTIDQMQVEMTKLGTEGEKKMKMKTKTDLMR